MNWGNKKPLPVGRGVGLRAAQEAEARAGFTACGAGGERVEGVSQAVGVNKQDGAVRLAVGRVAAVAGAVRTGGGCVVRNQWGIS